MKWRGRAVPGAGGASRAFLEEDGRRTREIEAVLGYRPCAGTLNLQLTSPFDWSRPHRAGLLLHRITRDQPEPLAPRHTRFYPVCLWSIDRPECGGVLGHIIRFDGARYPDTLVGVISPTPLRMALGIHPDHDLILEGLSVV